MKKVINLISILIFMFIGGLAFMIAINISKDLDYEFTFNDFIIGQITSITIVSFSLFIEHKITKKPIL